MRRLKKIQIEKGKVHALIHTGKDYDVGGTRGFRWELASVMILVHSRVTKYMWEGAGDCMEFEVFFFFLSFKYDFPYCLFPLAVQTWALFVTGHLQS